MSGGLVGVVAAVVIGAPFGAASAEVVDASAGLIEIEVTVEGPQGRPVVVHVVDPGGEQFTTSLAERSPGTHVGRLETRPADLVVVFEDVARGDQGSPTTLSALGVDPGELAPDVGTETSPGPGPQPTVEDNTDPLRWGWLALALGLGSLALVAVWAMPPPAGRKSRDPAPPPEEG